ncbi:MAG: LysE family translocator [Candidatus Neomarinimicrobiota bacterium]
MPDPAMLTVFVLAAFVLLITPGPAVIYVVARSLDQGVVAGLISTLAMAAGSLVHVAAAALGLSALLLQSALAFQVVKYLGAAYLIYLGIRRLLRSGTTPAPAAGVPRAFRRVFREGVLVSLLNPKSALFFVAFLPQFVVVEAGAVARQIVVLGLVYVGMGIVSDGLWALGAGRAAHWVRRSRLLEPLQRYVTGTVYVGLGLATACAGERR